MSTREVIGGVTITGPNARGYYKLKWTEPDGRSVDTSGGRTVDAARATATLNAIRIAQAAGPNAVTTLHAVKDAYLAQGHSPYGHKDPWKRSHVAQLERTLNRSLRGFEDVEALDVTRELLDQMRAQGGTDNTVRANTPALKGMLLWGYRTSEKYFTTKQSELLIRGGSAPSPAMAPGTRRPRRNTRPRNVGESEKYIKPEDAPGCAFVVSIGRELDKRYPLWGTLAAECAANLGFRWGEQFALTASDVHMDGCQDEPEAHVHVDWQVDSGAKAGSRRSQLTLPKGNKRRIVTLTDKSFTGYALEAELAARVEAALLEQQEGTNEDALLFPSKKGLMLWHTTFTRHLHIAMRATGWPYTEWTDDRDGKTKTVYHLTWHSLRHRYARVFVDDFGYEASELMAHGGWENELTVKNRYYRTSDENRRTGTAKSRYRK
jgi:integrase